jgi:hypothetical protein
VTPLSRALLFFLFAVVTGCSKHSAPAPEEPWVNEGEVVRAEASAGGFKTSYSAYFTETQLAKIVEARQGPREGHGEYTFTGARLVGYKGTALEREDNIEIAFDMKGAVTSSSKAATEQDITQIRTRAQLLRSLALAHRSTTQHSGSTS